MHAVHNHDMRLNARCQIQQVLVTFSCEHLDVIAALEFFPEHAAEFLIVIAKHNLDQLQAPPILGTLKIR